MPSLSGFKPTTRMFAVSIVAFMFVLYAFPAHAATEGEKFASMRAQIGVISQIVALLNTVHGEVLGAAISPATASVIAQKASLESAKAAAVARLAALKKIASTTPVQKAEIAALEKTRIPALNAQIAALVKQIAASQVVAVPPKPTPVPSKPAVTPNVTPKPAVTPVVPVKPSTTTAPTATSKPPMGPSNWGLGGGSGGGCTGCSSSGGGVRPGTPPPVRPATTTYNVPASITVTAPSEMKNVTVQTPVRIAWKSQGSIGSFSVSVVSKATGETVMKKILPATQLAFDWTPLKTGGYEVTVSGMWKQKVVATGSTRLVVIAHTTPVPPITNPVCTLTSDREEYTLGNTARFKWTTQNATKVSFVSDTSGKDNLVPPSGAQKLNGTVDIPMTVLGSPFITLSAAGKGKVVTCKKVIKVTEGTAAPSSITFTSPKVVMLKSLKDPVRLTWKGTELFDWLNISAIGNTAQKAFLIDQKVDPKQLFFNMVVPRADEYLVTLLGTLKNKPMGGATRVKVSAAPTTGGAQPSCTLEAVPATIERGASAELFWTVKNAQVTEVSIDNGVGVHETDGSGGVTVTPFKTTTYTLTATDKGVTTKCSQTVTIQAIRPRVIFGETGYNPDATTYRVEETESSEGNTLLVFSINSTSHDASDIAFRMFSIDVDTSNPSGATPVIDRLILRHNNIDIGDAAIEQGAPDHDATYMFALDKNIVVTPGDTEVVEVIAFFKPQDGNYPEGTTIKASVDIERSPYIGSFEVVGHGIGETHTLRTGGALLDINGVEEHFIANNDSITSDDAGRFIIDFEVTAFEQDVYIPATAVRGTGGGATYTMLSSTNGVVTSGTTVATLSSPATKTNGHYVVSEGETETFRLTVMYDPTTAGAYRLNLDSLNVKSSTAGSSQTTTPPEKYNTNLLLIKN